MDGLAMLALQQIDSTLDQIVHRRTRLEQLVVRAAAATALAEVRSGLDAAQRRAAEAQQVVDAAEAEGAELGRKRARLEAQLKTVIAPREAEALMHEIATIESHRSDVDDRELEALERQAEGEQITAEMQGRLPMLEADLAEADAALRAANAELDAEASELRRQRDVASASLTAADIDLYDRARKQFGGVAVARLDGLRCGGCHLDISRGEVDALRALPPDEPGECPQCGRFLVR